MEEGVLCLKWRDHRSTFLRMLSSIRRKGGFCDATLVCEGKFYPVHQLVLSTCSEYFQQVFEVVGSGTSGLAGAARTTGPLVVVLTGVLARDLEALLEYMYTGEATVLQANLAVFMKAAEGFKVRGLAEPPPPPSALTSASRRDPGEGTKRPWLHYDSRETKRKKEIGDSQKLFKEAPDVVSPAQLASAELSPETQRGMERDTATGTPGDLPGPVGPPSLPRPQVDYEEIQVKEEPHTLEEAEQEKIEQGDWNQQQQQATEFGERAETAQLLGFCDPGLTYLAHASGLGTAADTGHLSHQSRNLHTAPGWEAAGPCDTISHQTSGPLRAASQRRMGRPTSEIWLHYTTERAAGRTAVYCRYCSQKYGYPNATKMKIHILKCSKCPEEVRRQFETAKNDVSEGQEVASGRLGTEGGVPDPMLHYQAHQPQRATERPVNCPNIAFTSSGISRIEPEPENLSNSVQQEGSISGEKACSSSTMPRHGQPPNPPHPMLVKVTDAKQLLHS